MTATIKTLRPRRKGCPICSRPPQEAFLPFCSKRCADVDLSRWLTGSYAIPVVEEDERESVPDEGDGPAPRGPTRRDPS